MTKKKVLILSGAFVITSLLIVGVLFFIGVFDFDENGTTTIGNVEFNAGSPGSSTLSNIEINVSALRKGEILPEVETLDDLLKRIEESDDITEFFNFEILSFERHGFVDSTFFHYKITNKLEHDVVFSTSIGTNAFIGDEEVNISGFHERVPGETVIYNRHSTRSALNIGDTITFNFPLRLHVTDDSGRFRDFELGSYTFEFKIEDFDEPGSLVTNPEHISTHEDISLIISHYHFGYYRYLRTGITPRDWGCNIEIVLQNQADFCVSFERINVYVNGVQVNQRDFSTITLYVCYGNATRRRISFRYYDIAAPGDTIIISGNLSVIYDDFNIKQEIVEFTFVI